VIDHDDVDRLVGSKVDSFGEKMLVTREPVSTRIVTSDVTSDIVTSWSLVGH